MFSPPPTPSLPARVAGSQRPCIAVGCRLAAALLVLLIGVPTSPALAVRPVPPQILEREAVPKVPLAVRPVRPEVELRVVPSVIGLPESQARSVLERAGFATGGISRVANSAAAGTVVAQSVAPRTRHDPREPIDLRISRGPQPEIKVLERPMVDPESLRPAVREPEREEPPPHDDVQPGAEPFRPPVLDPRVIEELIRPPVRPQPPSEAPPYRPPPPLGDVQPDFIVVPQLREATLQQARARLALRRLRLGNVERRPSDARSGVVIDQSPEAGTQLDRPVAVNVVVSTGPERVTVPNVVGQMLDEARERLMPLSRGQIDEQWIASQRPRGVVVRQSPAAGTSVRPSPPPRFRLHVSAGPRRVVPDVVDRMRAEAEAIIGRADLRVGDVREVESDAPAGRVIDQKPSGGTDIVANRIVAVDLLVSRGPPPAPVMLEVPQVIGSGEQGARAQISGAGLTVGTVEREHSPQPAGIVVDQRPRGGTQVPREARVRVDLLVSLGPLAPPVVQTMPNLVGGTLEAAASLLEPLELSVTGVRSRASREPRGTVVAQQPAAGTRVEPGAGVDVAVSDGSLVRVPALVDRSRAEAAQLLRSADLGLQESTRETAQRHGIVLEQRPQAGAEVARGSAVQVVVAVAPGRAPTVEVPDVVGSPITPARQRIEAEGLTVATQEADSPIYEAGTVAAQAPAGGAQVSRDSAVQLTVSLGPPPLPDLVGMPVAQARSRLAQLGLSAAVSERRTDDQPRDVVLAQDPAAGVRLSRGAEVALVVSTGSTAAVPVTPTPPEAPGIPTVALVAGAAGGALMLAGGAFAVRRLRAGRRGEKAGAKRGVVEARVRLDPTARATTLTSPPAIEEPDVHFRVRLEHGEPRLQLEDGG